MGRKGMLTLEQYLVRVMEVVTGVTVTDRGKCDA
jgi:hypothetical protein